MEMMNMANSHFQQLVELAEAGQMVRFSLAKHGHIRGSVAWIIKRPHGFVGREGLQAAAQYLCVLE